MDFNDPKEFDDILVSPDPKGISVGSMDFGNPKVNGDKFILDGLVYVARLGSASLKIVQNKKRDKETLEKLILHNIVRLFVSGDAKCLNENTDTFTFSSFSTNLT